MTHATVSNVVRQLPEDRFVVEGGPQRGALGIQLGADATTFLPADVGGATVSRWRRPSLMDPEEAG